MSGDRQQVDDVGAQQEAAEGTNVWDGFTDGAIGYRPSVEAAVDRPIQYELVTVPEGQSLEDLSMRAVGYWQELDANMQDVWKWGTAPTGTWLALGGVLRQMMTRLVE